MSREPKGTKRTKVEIVITDEIPPSYVSELNRCEKDHTLILFSQHPGDMKLEEFRTGAISTAVKTKRGTGKDTTIPKWSLLVVLLPSPSTEPNKYPCETSR